MSEVADAIQQVKEMLISGVSPAVAFSETGEDYKLDPGMLQRRFERAQDGKTAEEWLAAHHERVKKAQELAKVARARAIEKAKTLATTKWRVQGHLADLAGRVFSVGKREYAYVVYGADNPAFAIRCVSLETQRVETFPHSMMPEIARQIAPQMQLAI